MRDQVDELLRPTQNCSACGIWRAIHDDRGRSLDTLYGRFRVKAPRLRHCPCEATAGVTPSVLQLPISDQFPERAAPDLQRLHAKLGSRPSFRDAARLMETFLPCAPQPSMTVRNRLGRITETLEPAEAANIDTSADTMPPPLTVFMDGAHILCRPEYQTRHPHSRLVAYLDAGKAYRKCSERTFQDYYNSSGVRQKHCGGTYGMGRSPDGRRWSCRASALRPVRELRSV